MRRDPATIGIYKRGSVYWLAQQRSGKRVFVSLGTEDFSEAILRAGEIRNAPELNAGGLLPAEIARYLAHKVAVEEFTRQTAANAKGFLKRLPSFFGDRAPCKISTPEAQGFYDRLAQDMSESSAQTYVAHARSFFRWCVDVSRVCRMNPFAEVKMADFRQVARKRFCPPDLRNNLIADCPRDDLRFVLFCGFHAGLRRNEIVEARPSWFDLDRRIIHLQKLSHELAKKQDLDPFDLKDKEERSVPLSLAFAKFLKEYLNPEWDYCIGQGIRRGKARYRYDFIRYFRDHMKTHHCSWVTPHTMRRTFGSLQVSNGISIYLVAKWLGDDIRTTTRHYGHLMPAHDKLEKGLG